MSLERLIDGLADADVSFVVVGMIAGQLYGSRVATFDLDIVYESTDANVGKIAAYMERVEAFVKETWPNEGVTSDFNEAVLRREGSVTLGTAEGEIGLLARIDGFADFYAVLAASEQMRLPSGSTVRVISLPALITAKQASNRANDRLHFVELEAIQEIRRRQ